MRTVIHPQQGLWLDSQAGLPSAHERALSQAGLTVQAVHALHEITQVLPGQWLAVRVDSLNELHTLADWLQSSDSALPVICRVPAHNLALTVAAMKLGAAHVVSQDEWSVSAWREAFQPASQAHALATQAAKETAKETAKDATEETPTQAQAEVHEEQAQAPALAPAPAQRSAVYVDPVSRHLFALAQRVGQAGVTALIEGPTGAGKEVLARVLHESSPRARGPFVGLNCATLPEQLIDDMLFGHEKGAFTGAQREHRGLFEQAQGGTIFLDEIGEMPLHLQAKLLRVLQERQLTRLGGERKVTLDVRVIAATNRDLRAAIAVREFREDLYFRISTFKLRIPALRERIGDILPLTACVLQQLTPAGTGAYSVSAEAQALLLTHAWPGNVRELENVVQRAVVLCNDRHIRQEHLMFDSAMPELAAPTEATLAWADLPVAAATHPSAVSSAVSSAMLRDISSTMPLPTQHASPANLDLKSHVDTDLFQTVRHNEHQLIMAAIEATDSRMEAARKLGISPRTLRYKLAKLKTQPVDAMALTGS